MKHENASPISISRFANLLLHLLIHRRQLLRSVIIPLHRKGHAGKDRRTDAPYPPQYRLGTCANPRWVHHRCRRGICQCCSVSASGRLGLGGYVCREAGIGACPLASLILVIVGWCLSALLGAWVAARIAHASKVLHGMIVGIFLLGAAITDLLEFPHPLWFWICGLLIFLPASYIGSGLALGKREQQ